MQNVTDIFNKTKDKIHEQQEKAHAKKQAYEEQQPDPKTSLKSGEKYTLESSDDKDNLDAYLRQGDKLVTQSGRYWAEINTKGRLSLHEFRGKELWKSDKDEGEFLIMQNDGNLVLYKGHVADLKKSHARWSTKTEKKGQAPFKLYISRGQLQVIDSYNKVLWTSDNKADDNDNPGLPGSGSNQQQGSLNQQSNYTQQSTASDTLEGQGGNQYQGGQKMDSISYKQGAPGADYGKSGKESGYGQPSIQEESNQGGYGRNSGQESGYDQKDSYQSSDRY